MSDQRCEGVYEGDARVRLEELNVIRFRVVVFVTCERDLLNLDVLIEYLRGPLYRLRSQALSY